LVTTPKEVSNMFVREKKITKNGKVYDSYYQVVEGKRVEGKVVQTLVGYLGKFDSKAEAVEYAIDAGYPVGHNTEKVLGPQQQRLTEALVGTRTASACYKRVLASGLFTEDQAQKAGKLFASVKRLRGDFGEEEAETLAAGFVQTYC